MPDDEAGATGPPDQSDADPGNSSETTAKKPDAGSEQQSQADTNPQLTAALQKVTDLEADNLKYRVKERERQTDQEKAKQKSLIDKGDHEKVIEQQTVKIDALEADNKAMKVDIDEHKAQSATEVESLLNDMSEEDLAWLKTMAWSDDPRKQLSILRTYLSKHGADSGNGSRQQPASGLGATTPPGKPTGYKADVPDEQLTMQERQFKALTRR